MSQLFQIIEYSKKNDPLAQKALVDHSSARMYSVARRYVSDDPSAYDVLQEAWINIFKNLNQFQESLGSFESWSTRIVIHQAIKWNKKFKTVNQIEILTELDTPMEDNILDDINAEQLFAWIRQLPKRCNEVFNMYVVDSFSHKEIAELLNISEGTSRSQLNYAKKLLQEKVNSSKLKIQLYG